MLQALTLAVGGMALCKPASGLSGCAPRGLHDGSFTQSLRGPSGDFLQPGSASTSASREIITLMAASS